MKLIDFRHVAEQNVLLAEQGAGDEVSHGGVVHLSRIALTLHRQMSPTIYKKCAFFVNCYSLLFTFFFFFTYILLRI